MSSNVAAGCYDVTGGCYLVLRGSSVVVRMYRTKQNYDLFSFTLSGFISLFFSRIRR